MNEQIMEASCPEPCGRRMIKMKLNYLTASELEMSREEVNLQIAFGLESCETKEDVCQLLDDVRAHEIYLSKEEKRKQALKELQEALDVYDQMESLYAELRKIPWYRFSERKQKIEELRIKQRRLYFC